MFTRNKHFNNLNIFIFMLVTFLLAFNCISQETKSEKIDNKWNFRLGGFNLGYGTRADIGYYKDKPGFIGGLDGITVAGGTKRFGFGVSIYEAFVSFYSEDKEKSFKGQIVNEEDKDYSETDFTANGLPESFLPVYLYFPLYWRTKKDYFPNSSKYVEAKSPFLYVFAGGSKWAIHDKDYLHFGVSILWSVGIVPTGTDYKSMYFGIQTGMFWLPKYQSDNKSIDNRKGYYLCVKLGYGGTSY